MRHCGDMGVRVCFTKVLHILDEISVEYEVFFEVDVYSWHLSEANHLIKHPIALFFGDLSAVFFLA